jgi:hypothetical protein
MPDEENVPEVMNLGPKRTKPAWEEEIRPGLGESQPGPAGIHQLRPSRVLQKVAWTDNPD